MLLLANAPLLRGPGRPCWSPRNRLAPQSRKSFAQPFHCASKVLRPPTLILPGDNHATRQVRQADGRRYFVSILTTGTGSRAPFKFTLGEQRLIRFRGSSARLFSELRGHCEAASICRANRTSRAVTPLVSCVLSITVTVLYSIKMLGW